MREQPRSPRESPPLGEISLGPCGHAGSAIESRLSELLAGFAANDTLRVLGPEDRPLKLPDEIIARARAVIAPGGIRPEGLRVYSPREELTSSAWEEVLGWHTLDAGKNEPLLSIAEAENRLRRHLRQQGLDAEHPRLYRIGNGLAHTLAYELGWMDQEDLNWLLAEHIKTGERIDNDCAYFTALDPGALGGYLNFNGGLYDQGRALFQALGIDLTHPEVHRLLNTAVLTEVDLRAYGVQLPTGHTSDPFLVIRSHILDEQEGLPVECLAPLPPTDRGEFGARIIAIVEHRRSPPFRNADHYNRTADAGSDALGR